MGTLLARVVVESAAKILQDETGTKWPKDEVLRWFNEAQRQVVLLRPDSAAITEGIRLVAGSLQSIPPGGWRMLDILYNLGIDGSTPGDIITLCERNILDTQIRGWRYLNPSAAVVHWIYDDRVPGVFHTFPPQPGTGQGVVLLQYSKSPAPATMVQVANELGVVGTVDTVITLDDVYQPALLDMTVYRCLCKQQAYVAQGLDQVYWGRAMQSLGLKTEVDKAFSPKKNAPPEVNKNVPYNTGAFGDQ